jgi:uncharacterized membrane protein YqjE
METLREDISTIAEELRANVHKVQDDVKTSITPLVSAILEDSQLLMRQELALAKAEARQELSRAKKGGSQLALGGALCLIAAFLGAITLVNLLLWNFPQLPQFAAYAIVTLIFGIPGALALQRAQRTFAPVVAQPTNT